MNKKTFVTVLIIVFSIRLFTNPIPKLENSYSVEYLIMDIEILEECGLNPNSFEMLRTGTKKIPPELFFPDSKLFIEFENDVAGTLTNHKDFKLMFIMEKIEGGDNNEYRISPKWMEGFPTDEKDIDLLEILIDTFASDWDQKSEDEFTNSMNTYYVDEQEIHLIMENNASYGFVIRRTE